MTTRDNTLVRITRDTRAIKMKRKKKRRKRNGGYVYHRRKDKMYCSEENLKYFCSIPVNIVRDPSNNTARTRNEHTRTYRIFLTHDCHIRSLRHTVKKRISRFFFALFFYSIFYLILFVSLFLFLSFLFLFLFFLFFFNFSNLLKLENIVILPLKNHVYSCETSAITYIL